MFEELGDRKFGVVLADCPWSFKTWSKKNQTRAAENHYKTMTLQDIKAMPVGDLALPDSVLFLWAINPMLPQAMEVIKAWGFEFKSVGFCWAKRTTTDKKWHIGLGYWSRSNIELCLLATKGKPKRVAKNIPQLVISPRRLHSQKPDIVYDHITKLVPGPYIDLFSRQHHAGWESWGDEAGKLGVATPFINNSPLSARQPNVIVDGSRNSGQPSPR